jgi:hypothetical protein
MKPTSRRCSSLTRSLDLVNIRVPDTYSSDLSSRYTKTLDQDTSTTSPSFTLTTSLLSSTNPPFESLDSTLCSIDSLQGKFRDVEPHSSLYKSSSSKSPSQDTDSPIEDTKFSHLRMQLEQRDLEIRRLSEDALRNSYQLRAFVMFIEELENKIARKEETARKLEKTLMQKELEFKKLRRSAKPFKESELEMRCRKFDERVDLVQKSIEEHISSLERLYINAIGREDFFMNQIKSVSRTRSPQPEAGDLVFKESADDQGRFKTQINMLQELLKSMSEGFDSMRINARI